MSSYEDIQKQIADLEKKAEEARKSEIAGAIAEVKEIMAKHSLSAADLGFKGGKKVVKPKGAAMYRDPASGKTWNGRGRKPGWFDKAEKVA